MSRRIIDIDQTVATSSEITAEASLSGFAYNTKTVSRQVSVATSTDVAVYLEARLAEDLAWTPIDSRTALSNGTSILDTIDTDRITAIRLRIVNNDGMNAAGIRAVVRA